MDCGDYLKWYALTVVHKMPSASFTMTMMRTPKITPAPMSALIVIMSGKNNRKKED
jgi:hypothetical protein